MEQGKKNLHERSPALSWITIGNLELDIGVPHGEPRRDVPPPGTIGWFRDLEERLGKHHPELVPDAEAARAALEGYRDWLRKDPGRADEHPGVGRVEFDWYLKHARLIPFTAEEILAFATHELKRIRIGLGCLNLTIPIEGTTTSRVRIVQDLRFLTPALLPIKLSVAKNRSACMHAG